MKKAGTMQNVEVDKPVSQAAARPRLLDQSRRPRRIALGARQPVADHMLWNDDLVAAKSFGLNPARFFADLIAATLCGSSLSIAVGFTWSMPAASHAV
jgi:hypothetical protein